MGDPHGNPHGHHPRPWTQLAFCAGGDCSQALSRDFEAQPKPSWRLQSQLPQNAVLEIVIQIYI